MDAEVIVIGAGAAGLAAARKLAALGIRAIVVEARDRVGGRAWSVGTRHDAVPAELGAEFIHGRAPETLALLAETQGTALDVAGESWALSEGELRLEDDDWTATAADILEGAAALERDQSVDAYLARFDREPGRRHAVETAREFVEGFEAADPRVASAQAIAAELLSGVDSRSARPLRGYAPLMGHLRAACDGSPVRFACSRVVSRIEWKRGEVKVETNAGTLRARSAIVTLPIGVLRRSDASGVRFEPALPPEKQRAIASIDMGEVVKVTLSFRSAFWEAADNERYRDAAFFRGPGAFQTYWTRFPARTELVVAWAGGPPATSLRELSASARIERAVNDFGALFGDAAAARSEYVDGFVHDWYADPFARGAYSYVTVGGGAARPALAHPVEDTLFFAGEASSSDGQAGTVNGALATGERAAREVALSLGMVV